MEFPLLQDIMVILGVSIVVLFLCLRFGIPTLVGLLLVGVISGPHGFAFLQSSHEVEVLAELGIALLLFSIGIELSLRRFLRSIREVVCGGGLQGALVVLGAVGTALLIGRALGEAIFLGFLLSLSSTAIILNILQEHKEIRTPHGQLMTSILIFQDIIVVPMLLLVPLLSGKKILIDQELVLSVMEGVALLVAVFIAGEWLVPRLLQQIAHVRSFKLFLFTVLFICTSVALFTAWLGLSLALGAFLSGLIISESAYHRHALGNVFPFQEIFTAFFFVATGMLLDLRFVYENPLIILVTLVGVLALKALAAGLTTIILGFPLRTAVMVGLGLSQVGEFSFVLVKAGMQNGIATPFHYQLFLAVALISMALSPLVLAYAPRFAEKLLKFRWPDRLLHGHFSPAHEEESLQRDHVLVAGLGATGKNLVHVLKASQVPYVIVDMDPAVVDEQRRKGEPIHFGDITHEAVLNHVGAPGAKIAAVLVNDPLAARHAVEAIRRLNTDAYIIARVRNVQEGKELTQNGADEAIPDEVEASVAIFSRTLYQLNFPRTHIDKLINDLYLQHYH